MIRDILQDPHDLLRVVSKPIDLSNPEQAKTAADVALDLEDTFNATSRAIGLAAPQIGSNCRIIIVDLTRRKIDRYIMVNPVIVKRTDQSQRVKDGCMSVKQGTHFASTKRPLGITVEWEELDGTKRKQKFRNMIAACIHHEIDHLDGRLFIDGAGK
jgi:peptide deformylase